MTVRLINLNWIHFFYIREETIYSELRSAVQFYYKKKIRMKYVKFRVQRKKKERRKLTTQLGLQYKKNNNSEII